MSMNATEKIGLKQLENLPINYIGRSANMLDIGFGEERLISTINGDKHSNSFNLHVQTGFRLFRKNRIIFSSQDMFIPSSGDYSTFEWDHPGGSVLDVQMNDFIMTFPNLRVKCSVLTDWGDLKIYLEKDFCLEIIVLSTESENWRLFDDNPNTPHIVMCGSKIQVD